MSRLIAGKNRSGYTKYGKSEIREVYHEGSNKPNISFFNFLLSEYGNVDFALELADSFINFASRFNKKSKKFQTVMGLLKYGIPATILTTELISKIKLYKKIKSGLLSVHNEKEDRLRQLIGKNSCDLWGHQFVIGKDILNWLMTEPQTKLFKILGYYTQTDLTKLNKLSEGVSEGVYILIMLGERKLVWDLSLIVYENGVSFRESSVHGDKLMKEGVDELRMNFFKEFLDHFDIKNNVIYVHSSGVFSYPRKTITENPVQFDVEGFEKEINKVLAKGKKRAAVFVGVPGVGKSTAIKKLESSVRDYPMIYCTPDCFSSTWTIQETFTLIQHIQPCIVVMEDMDSYDFKDKKKDLGVFLDEMDDVNGKLKAFFIATINDTSLVHYSLINRPGRFDQVFLLEPPKSAQEIYAVMKTRYDKNKEKDSDITQDFMSIEAFNENPCGVSLFKDIMDNKFTHADICEIVEKALLIDYTVTIKTLRLGFDALKSSKNAIASCNFSGHDPRSLTSNDLSLVEPTTMIEDGPSQIDLNFEVKGR